MTIRITKANISGFTGFTPDRDMVPVEPEQSQFYVPTAYEILDEFSIDLIFEGVYPDVSDPLVETYEYAIDVTSTFDWAGIGITFTKLNDYTVRLQGPAIAIFTNQYYKFKMADYSEKILPPDTQEPFFGLIEYKMPDPTSIMLTYPFEVTIPADPLLGGDPIIENIDMFQWFVWVFEVAEANIEAITARGLR
jgi:hypothetical protein